MSLLRAATRGLPLLGLTLLISLSIIPPPAAIANQTELIEHYRRAIQVDPGNADLQYALGTALLQSGDNRGATAALAQAYPAYRDNLELNYNFALAYARLGDVDNSLFYLDFAENLGAREQLALYAIDRIYFNLALLLNERGDGSEAERLLRKALELSPQMAVAHRLLGDLLARRGEIELAMKEFSACLELDPGDDTAREYLFALHYNRGLKFFDVAEQREEATKAFKAAIAVKPDSVLPYYYLGYLAYQAQNIPEAVASLLHIAPSPPAELQESLLAMLYNCGLTLLNQQRSGEAKPIADYLVSRKEVTARDLFLSANVYLALKDYEAASALYRRILALEPGHAGAANNLLVAQQSLADQAFTAARAAYQAGDYAAALPFFERAQELRADYPLAREYAAECRKMLAQDADQHFATAEKLLGSGNLSEAMLQVRQGLAGAPQSPRGLALEKEIAVLSRAEVERSLRDGEDHLAAGRFDSAESGFGRALALAPANEMALKGLKRTTDERRRRIVKATEKFHQALAGREIDQAESLLRELQQFALAPETAAALEREFTAGRDQEVGRLAHLGRQAFAENRIDDGRRLFQQALILIPDPALRQELTRLESGHGSRLKNLLSNAGKALSKNDFKQAQSALNQAKALDPTAPAVTLAWSDFSAALNRTVSQTLKSGHDKLQAANATGALSDFRKVLEVDPANQQAQQGLLKGKTLLKNELTQLLAAGDEFLRSGKLDKAEEAYRRVVSLDPYNAAARTGLDGIAQQRLANPKPTDVNALYLQGIDLYTRGRYEEAVALWERVLQLSPRHDKARMNIEKAKRKQRQIKEYRDG